ncbi:MULTISPECIES: M20/M25/M40 family metallo-hydrolase [unclassified Agromyces]|uniref:M20/M25/M40 family metallo-hydrolase n=1 Tax=unclassified Agromyces TaxID=2639701 RepID=UPI003014DAEC
MNHRTRTGIRVGAVAATAAVAASLAIAGSAQAAVVTDTSALRDAVTTDGVYGHMQQFQAIADANGGNRAAGTSGHVESLEYVEEQLQAAGYETWRQPFTYERTDFTGTSMSQTAPNPAAYVLGVDYFPMDYSGGGSVTAPVTAVDVNLAGDRASTSGCESSDFTGFPAGNIALIQRGSCDFAVKAANALAAQASAVIIFNQGNVVPGDDRLGLFGGTLGSIISEELPVVSAPFALGEQWVNTPGLVISLNVQITVEEVATENLLADTAEGRTDRTVVVGGHLDSVAEGPGINDNGSGIAAILETAIQMQELDIEPENRVRFAFWSGEEDGLIGSSYYVSQLTPREIKGHALNLNFDMIGSPNPVNFVYDGDGDALGLSGPNGSGVIEDVFLDFFEAEGEPTEPTDFDGRSDYFGFIEAGIPAGGLFTGAEGIKTAEQAARFGGTAGIAYDPCYHAACDTIANLDLDTLGLMSDAVAHSTLTFAETTSAVNGTGKGKAVGQVDWEYQGNRALR